MLWQMKRFAQNRKIVDPVLPLFSQMVKALASGLLLVNCARVDVAWMDVVRQHALMQKLLLITVAKVITVETV
jgi:hypothetical protein